MTELPRRQLCSSSQATGCEMEHNSGVLMAGMLQKRQGWIALLISCVGVAFVFQILPYRIDDAFIYFRYAEHIASGHGLTFNIGFPATEGFTSPLWTALLSLAAWALGQDALPHAALIFGLAAFCLCALVLHREARGAKASGHIAVTSSALLLCPPMVFYAGTGMESPLFALVVLVFAAAVADRVPLAWGIAAGVCGAWVRPEAPWLVVAWFAQAAASGTFRLWPSRRERLLLASVIGGALALLAVRWAVMGTLLPNTYYAKESSWANGATYVFASFTEGWLLLLLACAIAGAWCGERRQRGYLAAGVSWLLAAILEGGDWMPAGRFILPACTLFALASGPMLQVALKHTPKSEGWHKPRILRIVASLLLLATVASYGYTNLGNSKVAKATYDGIAKESRMLAQWVGASGAQSIAAVDIGQVGFRNPGAEIVDLGGLTDAFIAHSPGPLLGKRFDPSYVFEKRRPELIFIRLSRMPVQGDAGPTIATRDAIARVEQQLLRDPRMQRDYQLLFALFPKIPRNPTYGLAVFVRKGVQLPEKALFPGWLVLL